MARLLQGPPTSERAVALAIDPEAIMEGEGAPFRIVSAARHLACTTGEELSWLVEYSVLNVILQAIKSTLIGFPVRASGACFLSTGPFPVGLVAWPEKRQACSQQVRGRGYRADAMAASVRGRICLPP